MLFLHALQWDLSHDGGEKSDRPSPEPSPSDSNSDGKGGGQKDDDDVDEGLEKPPQDEDDGES